MEWETTDTDKIQTTASDKTTLGMQKEGVLPLAIVLRFSLGFSSLDAPKY